MKGKCQKVTGVSFEIKELETDTLVNKKAYTSENSEHTEYL